MKNFERMIKLLPDGIDAAIFTDSDVRFWLTDFRSSAGVLILSREKCCMFIDFRYIEAAKTAITEFEVVLAEKQIEQIKTFLQQIGAKKVAFLDDRVTVAESRRWREDLPEFDCAFEPELARLLTELGKIKQPYELERMKQAQVITDKSFETLLPQIHVGMTELEVTLLLETTLKKLGSEDLAFASIVVSGANSSKPHGTPTDKKLQRGDFLTMDFGAKFDGYCADMTRTICIGAPSEDMRKVYETVLAAQIAALAAIKPGVTGYEIDKIARDIIYGAGYEGCFGHGLGHGLGVVVHEAPRFAPSDKTAMSAGMALSVEPGIYLAGQFGVRIEDVVFITEDGCEDITKSPKHLICVE